MFSVNLCDGSVYQISDPRWQRALELKNPAGWNSPSFREGFCQVVAKYWEEKEEPTKFEFDEPWQEEYETQAALAEKVISLLAEAEVVEPRETVSVCRDPDDDKFLKCAIVGEVDSIVSEDEDLLVIREYRGIKIVKTESFFGLVRRGG